MDNKLTLKLDDDTIERAKQDASEKKEHLEKSSFNKSISVKKDWKEIRKEYIDYLDKKHT